LDYIYARVSTEGQDTDNQVSELKKKYPLAQVIEEVKSTKKVRPKLRDLLDIAEAGDRLIVWKLDRLSRSMMELQMMCADLDKRGVILISTTQDIDISKPMGKMFIAVLGWMAEMERDNISERTKLGMKNKRAIAEAEGKPWKKRKFYKYNSKGPPPVHRSKAMLTRLRELRGLKLTWDRVVEKLAYENIEWKIGTTTARTIYGRMYVGTQGRS